MPTELTREELFRQVWERPMTKVAADYGISDVALKKICVKHRIPVPGRGYWARKAANKKVEEAIFRAVADPAINRIVIYWGPAQHLLEAVKKVREAAKAREKRPGNKVEVPEGNGVLHPAVARTKKKIEKAKPSERGQVTTSGPDLFDLAIGRKSIGRVMTFLNALVGAAEARGYQIIKGNRALVLFVDDESLEIKIVEEITRSKHTPTDAERAAIAKWEKRQQRLIQALDYSDWTLRPTPPEWDYTPNGRLRVIINEGTYATDGLRRTFGDGSTQRIETLINGVLEALATWSAAIKVKRAEDERRAREWQEEEKSRQEAAWRHALEVKREEFLERQMNLWEEARRIDAFVKAYRVRHPDESLPPSCQQLIEWAGARSAALHGAIAPDRLAEELDRYRLMDDDAEIDSWVKFD